MDEIAKPRVAVFGPNPLLTVTIEAGDEVHLHAGGQGAWVARMAAELGARVTLCSLVGGETGAVVAALLAGSAIDLRGVPAAAGSGCYVMDRRNGSRDLIAHHVASAPSRHELDDLVSITCAAALESDVLVVCNPYPADALPLDVYGKVVGDVRDNGIPVLVDLSSPRLDSALQGCPDLVKLNDWELAEFVCGPVGEPHQLRAAAEQIRDRGAGMVVVTRGPAPAFVLRDEETFELVPPRFEHGSREGCGDSMMGAIAFGWTGPLGWEEALTLGAAAGAANFLRHGLGTGSHEVVEELRRHVELRALDRTAA